jgi:ABC-type uncharacterized transport system permease subunit
MKDLIASCYIEFSLYCIVFTTLLKHNNLNIAEKQTLMILRRVWRYQSVDRIILSFRKLFLAFYIYLLLIWLFFMLLSTDTTTSCSKSLDRYHFGSAGISVDFYVYVPINTYRYVEEQFFYIFIVILRIHLLRLSL